MHHAQDQAATNQAIQLASNAWRWRQLAIARRDAGDVAGALEADGAAAVAEAEVVQIADALMGRAENYKGKRK